MNQELVKLKGKIHSGREQVYVVTARRGRKRVAHLYDEEEEEILCGVSGKRLKLVDSATVERHYSVCEKCKMNC